MSFTSLGLNDSLLRAVSESGYETPTPIQSQAIPAILAGHDVMAAARTGTGKTAGFTLPLLQRLGDGKKARSNHVRALVLTPTRELAAQVQACIETYGTYTKLSSHVVFGGVKINPQLMAMRKGTDILVATPGRLLDLYQQNAVKFDDLETLVLDEADRMLDMGFIHDIRRILALLPSKRQNLMFSATFSNDIRKLAKKICNNPVEIDVSPRNSTVELINQQVFEVKKEEKVPLLISVLKTDGSQSLVFSRTKHGANKLVKVLTRAGITAAAIHGNKSQNQRMKALEDFKSDQVQVLVATDIAARGIDIDQLARVINFDLPNVPEDYVHRIGRTGRAGATGLAVSLVSPEEIKLLRDIEKLTKQKIERAPLPEIESFDGELPDFADLPRGQVRRQSKPGASSSRRNNSGNSGQKRAEGAKPRRRRKPAARNGNKDSGAQSARKSEGGENQQAQSARGQHNASSGNTDSGAPKRRRRSARKGKNERATQKQAQPAQSRDKSDKQSGSAFSGLRRFFSSGSDAA